MNDIRDKSDVADENLRSRIARVLRVISRGDSVELLRNSGYTYTQISMLVERAISSGFVVTSERGLRVTPVGQEFMHSKKIDTEYPSWPLRPRAEHKVGDDMHPFLYIPPRRTLKLT